MLNKCFLLTFWLVISGLALFAQKPMFGVSFGGNFSHIKDGRQMGPERFDESYEYKLRGNVGLVADIPIYRNLRLQSGISYSKLGMNNSYRFEGLDGSELTAFKMYTSAETHYGYVPVMLKYNFPSLPLNPYVLAGVGIGYFHNFTVMGQHYNVSDGELRGIFYMERKMHPDYLDISSGLGIGIEPRIGKRRFAIEGRYARVLTNTDAQPFFNNYKVHFASLNIIYFFPFF